MTRVTLPASVPLELPAVFMPEYASLLKVDLLPDDRGGTRVLFRSLQLALLDTPAVQAHDVPARIEDGRLWFGWRDDLGEPVVLEV